MIPKLSLFGSTFISDDETGGKVGLLLLKYIMAFM
jgi:hypothetical protein